MTGKFRRALDPSCAYFTVASVHINDEYAKRRFLFISLFLLIRDLCIKLGAVILTSDFIKGAERELASSAPADQRRISPLEAAFSHANIPWPTSGVTPLWGPRRRVPRIAKPLDDHAPQVHQRRPCVYRVEDHGLNSALRAMASPPVCWAQAKK